MSVCPMIKVCSLIALLIAFPVFGAPLTERRIAEPDLIVRGPWTPETRRENRPDALWLYYMHGIVDHFANTVDLDSLLSDEQRAAKQYRTKILIDTPFRRGTLSVLRMSRSDKMELAHPLPMDMQKVRGQRIRIFIWMKGDNAGARNNDYHCPSMTVMMKDAGGKVLSSSDASFKTQRTFPWHCYYADRFVPANAAGVYLSLFNKFTGAASFAMPSWELITDQNTYSANEKQDPLTGSLAFNPMYDPMPYHIDETRGTLGADKYPWRFVLGDKIGLIGQPFDITTKEGFRTYYFQEAKNEPDHMNHGILYMGMLYRTGMKKKLLPPMEDGWLDNFAQILISDQDENTGYWHDGKSLSLGLTFHLVDAHFRYKDVPRADRPDVINPDMDLGLKNIPRAGKIIETSLMMQASWVDPQGVTRKAAWNRSAYGYTTTPDASKQKCDFGTTWDAISLIRRSSNYVDEETRKKVESSVRDAFEYVLRFNVLDDGTFKQADTDAHPTKAHYMTNIMQDSAWLERKIDPQMPAPAASASASGGQLTLTWSAPISNQNSVRLYAIAAGADPQTIDESHLVGIIHRTGHKIYEMDPILGCQKIRQGLAGRWGANLELPPPDDWRGRRYLAWKLRKIHFPVPSTTDLAPLTLARSIWQGNDLYLSAVSWYGEESAPIKLTTE